MKAIALDLTPAITGATGIARYVTELHRHLAGAAPDVDVRGYAVGRAAHPPPPGVRHVRVPHRIVDAAWRYVRRPSIERVVGSVDSVHASGATLPPSRAPIVAVVHDLAAVDHPELHPRRDAEQLRRYLGELHRAAAVIAVSDATAQRLAGAVDATRLHVVPQGRAAFPPPVDPPLAGRPYLLTVGAAVPRKRYDLVVRALAHLDEHVELAMVGPEGSEDGALADLAQHLGLGERVHRVGPVDEAQLAGWYASAAALVAPSVDEGFGLPLVEALTAGVPVVATDIPVHREVTGGGAVLVDLDHDLEGEERLVQALGAVLAGGPEVQDALDRGRQHVARYSWEACAAATLAVHRSVW